MQNFEESLRTCVRQEGRHLSDIIFRNWVINVSNQNCLYCRLFWCWRNFFILKINEVTIIWKTCVLFAPPGTILCSMYKLNLKRYNFVIKFFCFYFRHILPPLISLRSCNLIYRKYRKFSFTLLHGFRLHLFHAIKRIPFLKFQQAAPGREVGGSGGGMNGDWGNVEFVPSVGIGADCYQWRGGLSYVINDLSPTPRRGFRVPHTGVEIASVSVNGYCPASIFKEIHMNDHVQCCNVIVLRQFNWLIEKRENSWC